MLFRELAGIVAAGPKGEMGSRCLMEGTQVIDLSFPVAAIAEFGADRFRYHLQGIGTAALEKTRVLHVVSEVGAIRGLTQRRDGAGQTRGGDGLDQAPLWKADPQRR